MDKGIIDRILDEIETEFKEHEQARNKCQPKPEEQRKMSAIEELENFKEEISGQPESTDSSPFSVFSNRHQKNHIGKNSKWIEDAFKTYENWRKEAALKSEAPPNISDLLNERQKTHGDFELHADISVHLKAVIHGTGKKFTAVQIEALDMLAHKIGRIVAGNADFVDHWDDIAGYATLVANILRKEDGSSAAKEGT
jgi:hypothetical protein